MATGVVKWFMTKKAVDSSLPMMEKMCLSTILPLREEVSSLSRRDRKLNSIRYKAQPCEGEKYVKLSPDI